MKSISVSDEYRKSVLDAIDELIATDKEDVLEVEWLDRGVAACRIPDSYKAMFDLRTFHEDNIIYVRGDYAIEINDEGEYTKIIKRASDSYERKYCETK
jgi:hypothetical protein